MQATQYASIQGGQAAITAEPNGDVSRQVNLLRSEIDMLESITERLIESIGPVLFQSAPSAPTVSSDSALDAMPPPATTVVGKEVRAAQERLCRIRRNLIEAADRVSI